MLPFVYLLLSGGKLWYIEFNVNLRGKDMRIIDIIQKKSTAENCLKRKLIFL